MKELKFEELTTRQKLGMCFTAFLNGIHDQNSEETIENNEFVFDLIRNKSLGAVWVQYNLPYREEFIKKVKELADYPILIITDAESGIGEYTIGRHNAIAATGREDYAYVFGKSLGVGARKMGYNVVCNPVLDMIPGGARSLGTDKEKVSELAVAIAKGMHDGGVLTVAKHYPGGNNPKGTDSHMAESYSDYTEEQLIDYSLYPYMQLYNKGLLDGLMTQHKRFINIDPENPASLSEKVIGVIRKLGFDGFAITDALVMMGVRAKYGEVESKGLAIAAGNDTILPYYENIKSFNALCECYDKGMISDERVEEAARRILAAQHKTLTEPAVDELTEEDIEKLNNINKDGIYAKTDEGLSTSISRDGKHFFAIMIRNEFACENGQIAVDTFSNTWQKPDKTLEKIKELFPNSKAEFIYQFPNQNQNLFVLEHSIDCEDVIFLTFSEPLGYVGKEHLTRRIEILIDAMQITNRISTVVHCGNPTVLENLPHIPRYILGGLKQDSLETCLDVLAGNYPANGVLTCDVTLN